jgi:hypothetical protein
MLAADRPSRDQSRRDEARGIRNGRCAGLTTEGVRCGTRCAIHARPAGHKAGAARAEARASSSRSRRPGECGGSWCPWRIPFSSVGSVLFLAPSLDGQSDENGRRMAPHSESGTTVVYMTTQFAGDASDFGFVHAISRLSSRCRALSVSRVLVVPRASPRHASGGCHPAGAECARHG